MGNFFTNDAGGALLGALAGKLVNDAQARQHNARWKDAYELTQQQMGVNEADRAAAEKKVLANTGMDQYLGIDPRDGILQDKKLYADAQAGYNRALAAGDTQQQKYYQGLMDNEHSKADFWRKIAQFKDLDLTGYGSGDTLDEATKRQLNKLVEAQNPTLPSTVGTTLTDLGGGLQGPLGAAVQKEHDYRASVEDFRKMYGDEIKEAAEEEARARVMNPQWGKELEYKLREKFISPQIISDMLKYGQDQRQQMYSSEVIQSAIDKLKAGEFSDYYSTGLRALQENPTLAKTILSGAPAPRDFYGTQTGRENMALQHGYRLDTMGKQFDYGQKAADAALERTAEMSKLNLNQRVELMLRSSNIKNQADRERMLMMYGVVKAVTGSHEEALKYVFDGGKGKSDAATQQKMILGQIDNIYKGYDRWQALYPDKTVEEYPYKDRLEWANKKYNEILGIRDKQPAQFDENDYYAWGDFISRAIKKGYSKEQLARLVNEKGGDLAPALIRDFLGGGTQQAPQPAPQAPKPRVVVQMPAEPVEDDGRFGPDRGTGMAGVIEGLKEVKEKEVERMKKASERKFY